MDLILDARERRVLFVLSQSLVCVDLEEELKEEFCIYSLGGLVVFASCVAFLLRLWMDALMLLFYIALLRCFAMLHEA